MRTTNYRQTGSQNAERVATFRQQMADFARGDRLRRLRDDRHLSQEETAHEIGVSVKTIRAWEKGAGIRWRNAQALADFYGVEANSLVRREGINGEIAIEGALDPDVAIEIRNRLDSIDATLDEQASTLALLAGHVSALRTGQQHGRTSSEPDAGAEAVDE